MATLEEYEKFIANEPEAEIEYRTIEAYSTSFGTRRWVFDFLPQSFVIEAGAPRNPSETVFFEQATGRVQEPSERDDGEQQLSISFGGIDAELNQLVDSISGAGYLDPVEIIYRKYYSGDLSAPAMAPLYLQVSSINFENRNAVTVTAEDPSLAMRRPGRYYLTNNFPGLKP